MSDSQPDITGHSEVRYEQRDVNERTLFAVGIGVLIAASIIGYGVLLLFDYFAAHDRRKGMEPSTLVRPERVAPRRPQLQVDPARELKEMRMDQEKVLTSYSWVDQQQGVVRIPIDRAMQLLVERGLPTVTPAATAGQKEVTQPAKQNPANGNRRKEGKPQP
jgi:hypothetical protein